MSERKKPAEELTTDEVMRRLFPRRVKEEADAEIAEEPCETEDLDDSDAIEE